MTFKGNSCPSGKNSGLRLVAVIPAFNEECTLKEVAEATLKHIDKVIVVNDGSTDNTVEQLHGLKVEIISNSENQGKGSSLWRGFASLLEDEKIDAALTLDGDGQHAPEDIDQLLAEYAKSPGQMVVGLRTARGKTAPPLRFLANQFANFWVSWAAGNRIPDSQCGFRIYPVALLRKLQYKSDKYKGFVFESEVLIDASRLGFGIRYAPVKTIYQEGRRKSHYRPVRDTAQIALMIAGKLFSSHRIR